MKSRNWWFSSISKPEAGLGLAACLSLALIFMPSDMFSRSMEIHPFNYPAYLVDDQHSGGDSVVLWVNRDIQQWACRLGTAYENPYCSIQIAATDAKGRGLNLEKFTKMKVWATYKGDATHIRIYLRNRHPDYYIPEDGLTTKYNTVELPTAELKNGFEINMSDFSVASWWLVQKNIPLIYSKPQFNDISIIEVQTGSETRTGVHDIQLNKIALEGPIVPEVTLYRAATLVWSILILGLLVHRVVRLRIELNKNKHYQEELVTINKVLSLQNREFEELAMTDHLTGLLNRVGIRDALYDGLKAWKSKKQPFSLILIDIDHFKAVNDTHGHDVGDDVLKCTAGVFNKSVRKDDFLARWGGEEFILLCPNTTLGQALGVAESLRKKLEEEPGHSHVKVTASFGVASMCEPDLDHLFKCADDALYLAKKRGRNCVMTDINLSVSAID